MNGHESWIIKKAQHWRTDAFHLWRWRRPLRVPWTARRSNQSILKDISPGCSLEGLMLKLKTPIFWPPEGTNWLIWKDPNFGKDWGQEEKGTTGWDGWMISPTLWTWVWVYSGSWWWTGRPGMLQVHGVAKSWTRPNWTEGLNWTELKGSRYRC